MSMESAQLTEEYYRMITGSCNSGEKIVPLLVTPAGTFYVVVASYRQVCSNGIVLPEGETVMVTPNEVFELIEKDEKDEAIDACANCPHMGQCSEPIPLDCPLDG